MLNNIEKIPNFAKTLDVLFVTDCPYSESLVSKFFKKVYTASNEIEGFNTYYDYSKLNNKYIDIVISDISTPNMNGIELSKKINYINNSQIILIISDYIKPDELVDLINIGISKFIKKPIELHTMNEIFVSLHKKLETSHESNNNKFLLEKIKKLEIEKETMRKLVITDKLTQLNNRHYIDSYLDNEILSSKRYGTPLSIMLLDIDNFKTINDRYGHLEGDKVLVLISNILKKLVRESDTVGRWGGEEFIIICKNTNLTGCIQLAKSLKEIISSTNLYVDKKITASFGVAYFNKEESHDELIHRADKALYESKRSGKNKITHC